MDGCQGVSCGHGLCVDVAAPGTGYTCSCDSGYFAVQGSCRPNNCGDSRRDSNEDCDDGNTIQSDGCSRDCVTENGYTCTSGQPDLCSVVACAELTISMSNTAHFAGNTNDSRVVVCNDGFVSSAGVSFIATCMGNAPGQSSWSNALTCIAVSCPSLTVSQSDTSNVNGLTFDTRIVNCNDGYEEPNSGGSSFIAVCAGTAPGQSFWSNVLTCQGILATICYMLFISVCYM